MCLFIDCCYNSQRHLFSLTDMVLSVKFVCSVFYKTDSVMWLIKKSFLARLEHFLYLLFCRQSRNKEGEDSDDDDDDEDDDSEETALESYDTPLDKEDCDIDEDQIFKTILESKVFKSVI